MRAIYTVGDFRVVIVSATYGVIDRDGRIVYSTIDVEDAIETAEEIHDRVAA
jgi:hypothetical protein